MFQEFRATNGDIIQLIPFVCAFYGFESYLFYSRCNCEGDVIIIPFAMGTCQGDPWGGRGGNIFPPSQSPLFPLIPTSFQMFECLLGP
jgi:hypothetical protein